MCSVPGKVHWIPGCLILKLNGKRLPQRCRVVAPLSSERFRGALRVVTELATRRRRAEQATDQQLQKIVVNKKMNLSPSAIVMF